MTNTPLSKEIRELREICFQEFGALSFYKSQGVIPVEVQESIDKIEKAMSDMLKPRTALLFAEIERDVRVSFEQG